MSTETMTVHKETGSGLMKAALIVGGVALLTFLSVAAQPTPVAADFYDDKEQVCKCP